MPLANQRWWFSRCENPVAERSVRRRNRPSVWFSHLKVPAPQAKFTAARQTPPDLILWDSYIHRYIGGTASDAELIVSVLNADKVPKVLRCPADRIEITACAAAFSSRKTYAINWCGPGFRIAPGTALPSAQYGVGVWWSLSGGSADGFLCATGHRRERAAGVDQAIFIYCCKGKGWCELGGSFHIIKPGELLVVPPDTAHAYGADASQPWSIFWFHAQGALLGDYLRELDVSVEQPVIRLGASPQVPALFEELLEQVEQGYTKLQMLCAAQTLSHLLAVMIREHRSADQRQPSLPQKIAQTIAYMKQHLDRALHLELLAAIAGRSRSRCVELFWQQTGYAPIDYFIRLRMHQACQLLDTTDLSVKAIATTLSY